MFYSALQLSLLLVVNCSKPGICALTRLTAIFIAVHGLLLIFPSISRLLSGYSPSPSIVTSKEEYYSWCGCFLMQLSSDACALHSSALDHVVLLPGLEVAGRACSPGGGKRCSLYPVALQCFVLDSLTCSKFGAEPVQRTAHRSLFWLFNHKTDKSRAVGASQVKVTTSCP